LVLTLLGLGSLAACGSLDEKQRAWIFQPGKATWSGSVAAAEGMDEVWLHYPPGQAERASSGRLPVGVAAVPGAPGSAGAADIQLNGLWLDQPGVRDAPVLLYLHGARWNVRSSANRMRRFHSLGFAVLAIDYRGFGKSSEALPSEASAAEDARAAWAWLARTYPERRRFIYGHSLGGAIAIELAGQVRDEAGVIVEATFTSIPDVVATLPWGWLPVGPLITQRFESARRVGQVGSPLLVVHGSEDQLIPLRLGEALYAQAQAPKRFLRVDGGTHHNTSAVGLNAYREVLGEFFGVQAAPVVRGAVTSGG
jgi:alpha-beta hydrolase superfamily lysophospholipase